MTQTREWTLADARDWIAVPPPQSDKYSRGVLGVVTGSARYPGAAVLGVEAAARTGVGMIRYLGDDRAAEFVLHRRPEVVTAAGRVQAWLLGSGMDASSRGGANERRLRDALAENVPAVVDAGALDLVAEAAGPVVVTPHFRELARMLGAEEGGGGRGSAGSAGSVSPDAIAAEPAVFAARAADTFGVTVLLKGSTTYVAAPGGEILSASYGSGWLATAGTGDVLGGVLGALVATHADRVMNDGHAALARLAAAAAVLHAVAASRAGSGGPIVALDVAEALPATIAAVLAGDCE